MPTSADIPILPRGDRGFVDFGTPLHCTYGTEITVYESSSAMGPHAWLKLQQDSSVFRTAGAGEAVAHLTVGQAQDLIARLQRFVEYAYETWEPSAINDSAPSKKQGE